MFTSDEEDYNQKHNNTTKDDSAKKKRKREASRKYREKLKIQKALVQRSLIIENNSTTNEKLDESNLKYNVELDGIPMEVCTERPLGLTSSSENDLNNDSFSFCNKNSESDTDESRTGDINNEVNLFENSPTSVDSLVKSVLNLMYKHRLSDEAVKDYLKLMKSTLINPNKCPSSVKAIYDHVLKERDNYITRNFFCKNCQKCMESMECPVCKGENIYFITLDVAFQIKSIIRRQSIREKLLKNQNENLINPFILESCKDGVIYQDYLRTSNFDISISLCLNTDGAPVVVSKGLSLWPVLAKIIELPESISESFENLIFIGLWLDNMKPNSEIFISKCVDAILKAKNDPSLENLGKLFRNLLFRQFKNKRFYINS
jgi:hypothetical protein